MLSLREEQYARKRSASKKQSKKIIDIDTCDISTPPPKRPWIQREEPGNEARRSVHSSKHKTPPTAPHLQLLHLPCDPLQFRLKLLDPLLTLLLFCLQTTHFFLL